MAKRKSRKSERKDWKQQASFELIGLALLAISAITLANLGKFGKTFVLLFKFFFGEFYFILPVGLLVCSIYMIIKRQMPKLVGKRLWGIYIFVVAFLLAAHIKLYELPNNSWNDPSIIKNTWDLYILEVKGKVATTDLGGGMIGALFFAMSFFLFEELGAKIVVIFLFLIAFILITGKSLGEIFTKLTKQTGAFFKNQFTLIKSDIKQTVNDKKEKRKAKEDAKNVTEEANDNVEELATVENEEVEVYVPPIISNFKDAIEESETKPIETLEISNQEASDPVKITFVEMENKDYILPPLDLLNDPTPHNQYNEQKQIEINVKKLEKTFQSFGVRAKVAKVHLGPAVTKYEVYPDIGVKVSKIVSLHDDLALALAAKDIRIEAPIPGKSAIGIEVPNSEVSMVSLKEVIDSKNNNPNAKLMYALGRDISGEAILAELNKMPHMLIAGSTGSGKSVCVNGIIVSILMRAKPHEVKMMMIDPKMVELNVYNGIPHLLAPVVTDPKKASQALKKVVSEMERRYDLFSHTGTRNIEGYNDYIQKQNEINNEKHPSLPYIVVLVDELADLMMVASSDVEDSITRLAQMARASGIHLIIATQRPSVDIITGVIKANIPSRIAFSVSSATDSRTILDMGGAEKLLGRGDMLFLPSGSNKPTRIQGAFLSDAEVERVVNYVISQQQAQYQEEMIPEENQTVTQEVDDELFDDAVSLVLEMQTASVSMLQRRFRIGYARAARLIDAMEDRGIVGPYEGSKPREVLRQQTNDEASSQ